MTDMQLAMFDESPSIDNDEFEAHLRRVFDRMIETNRTKGREYRADRDDNIFDNFIRNGERLGESPLKVLGLYMFKHIDAIETWFKRGCPVDTGSEPITGRMMDVILYMNLLWSMYENLVAQMPGEVQQDDPVAVTITLHAEPVDIENLQSEIEQRMRDGNVAIMPEAKDEKLDADIAVEDNPWADPNYKPAVLRGVTD